MLPSAACREPRWGDGAIPVSSGLWELRLDLLVPLHKLLIVARRLRELSHPNSRGDESQYGKIWRNKQDDTTKA
jgi:hypothetical protein